MFSADEAGTAVRESDEIRINEQIDFDMMDLLLLRYSTPWKLTTLRQSIATLLFSIYIYKSYIYIKQMHGEGSLALQM
jgi:hypothetical protein